MADDGGTRQAQRRRPVTAEGTNGDHSRHRHQIADGASLLREFTSHSASWCLARLDRATRRHSSTRAMRRMQDAAVGRA